MKNFKNFIQEDIPFSAFSNPNRSKGAKRGIYKKHKRSINDVGFSIELEFTYEGVGPNEEAIRAMIEESAYELLDPDDYYGYEYLNPEDFMDKISSEKDVVEDSINRMDEKDVDYYELKAYYSMLEALEDYLVDIEDFNSPNESEINPLLHIERVYQLSPGEYLRGLAAKMYLTSTADKLLGTKEYVNQKKRKLEAANKKFLSMEFPTKEVKAKKEAALKKLKFAKEKAIRTREEILGFGLEGDEAYGEYIPVDDARLTKNFYLYANDSRENYLKPLKNYIEHYKIKGTEGWQDTPLFADYLIGNIGERTEKQKYTIRIKDDTYSWSVDVDVNDKGFVNTHLSEWKNHFKIDNPTKEYEENEEKMQNYFKKLSNDIEELIKKKKFFDNKGNLTFVTQTVDGVQFRVVRYDDNKRHLPPYYRNRNWNLGLLFYHDGEGVFDIPVFELSVTLSYYDAQGNTLGSDINIDPIVEPLFVVRDRANSFEKVPFRSQDPQEILDYVKNAYMKIKENEKKDSWSKALGDVPRNVLADRIFYASQDRFNDFWDEVFDSLKNYYEWTYGGVREFLIEEMVQNNIDSGEKYGALQEVYEFLDLQAQLKWDVEDDYGKIEIKTDGVWNVSDIADLIHDIKLIDEESLFVPCSSCSCHIHVDDVFKDNIFGFFTMITMFDEPSFTSDNNIIGDNRDHWVNDWATPVRDTFIRKILHNVSEGYLGDYSQIIGDTDGAKTFRVTIKGGNDKRQYMWGSYPGIRPNSNYGTIEFRYPSSNLISNSKQIIENIQYFVSLMVVANNKRVARFHYDGVYYIMVKEDNNSFLIQQFDSGRHERSKIHPEIKKYL